MTITMSFIKATTQTFLKQNPTLTNSALSGTIRAHLAGFHGCIDISDSKMQTFTSGEKRLRHAKTIRISPYGFWQDLLISIKRIFTGVVFAPSTDGNDLKPDLESGRRITIDCSLDGSTTTCSRERNQQPLHIRIYKTARAYFVRFIYTTTYSRVAPIDPPTSRAPREL